MARPKEFDQEEVLQKAMNVFWHRGYEATSMQDLVDAMGIKRQSLYDTFGDKHSLYLTVLERYRLEQEENMTALLTSSGSLKKKLRQILEQVIKDSTTDKTRRGCFMNNAISEMVAHDEKTKIKAVTHINYVEQTFEKAIKRAQESGEISNKHNAKALARYFFNAFNGLRVVAKTNPEKQVLVDIVNVTLSVFN